MSHKSVFAKKAPLVLERATLLWLSKMLKANELYKVSTNKSREKCLRFFGEQSVPIHVGDGSSSKLKNFFVQQQPAAMKSSNPSRDKLSSRSTAYRPLPHALTSNGSSDDLAAGFSKDWTNEMKSFDDITNDVKFPDGFNSRRYSMPSPIASVPITPLVNKSTSKIQKVLGNSCPVDISLSEIEQNGLVSLLQSKIPLCFFLAYLLENRIPEILFFITDVIEFESRVFPSHDAQQSAAHMVFQLYLNKTSPLEANFTHKAKLACATQIKLSAPRSCFELPHKEAMVLLEEAYNGFKESKVHAEMTAVVGNSQIHDKVAESKVKRLVQKVLDSCYVIMPRQDDFHADQDRLAKQVECVHRNSKLFVAKYAKREN